MRAIVRLGLPTAAMLLLVGCGDGEPGPVASVDEIDDEDFDDLDLESLDDALDEMRDQLEELGAAAEAFELDEIDQGDTPLLLPADVTVTGDLEGTYTDNPGCDVEAQYIDPDDGHHEDVLAIRFGWAGHTVDWSSELPEDPRPLSVLLHAPGFDGAGTYDAFVTIAGVDVWADGTAQLTIVENRREEFPTGEIVVIEGELSGSWSGEAGSGQVAGDLGVCNVRAP